MSAPPCPLVDFVYAATVKRWVDGDTVDVIVDLGFRATRTERLRLLGCDTPERSQEGYTEATAASRALAPAGALVTIQTYHDVAETFGRFVADVWTTGGVHIPFTLIERGHAKVLIV